MDAVSSIAASQTNVPRESFQFPRALEYLHENELAKQIGYPKAWWPLAILKELIDNSLDACEEIGVLPEINLSIDDSSITVEDNGGGIPPETVRGMCDFDVRESSRALYRSLTRGAQGNAAKCLLCAPYVLSDGDPEYVIIEARITHRIRVGIDEVSQQPRVEYHAGGEKVHSGHFGTRVTLNLPCVLANSRFRRFVHLAVSYVSLNPHLRLKLSVAGEEITEIQDYQPTVDCCPKWTAAHPDPPHWYTQADFEQLVGACIRKDQESGTDRPLSDFLEQFAGLKRPSKRKALTDAVGLPRGGLSCLLNGNGLDRDMAQALHAAMKQESRTPKAERLGVIGRDHITQKLIEAGVDGEVKYKLLKGTTDQGLPFVVEAAFGELADDEECWHLITGCNFSPSIGRLILSELPEWLERQRASKFAAVAVLFHVATPSPSYRDRGKSVLDLDESLEDACEKAIVAVTAEYAKRQKASERDAARALRAEERWRARQDDESTSLKDAIVAVLGEAISKASGGGTCEFSDRELYYAARPLVQQYTSADLTQKYFDTVVDEWEKRHGIIEDRLKDARGFFVEPHGGERVELSTKAVEEYIQRLPRDRYPTILVFEKKHLEAKARWGKIPERFDCAIMGGEGYGVRAAKRLLQAAQDHLGIKILVFHDGDPDGYNICRTLGLPSGAHDFNFEVIDAGLGLEEALEMGLQTETFTRKKELPAELELTNVERKYFEGEPARNGKGWTSQRVELNALSADPARFVQWVESKLAEHGVAKKLIPDDDRVEQRAREIRERQLRSRITDAIHEELDLERIISEVNDAVSPDVEIADLSDDLREWAVDTPPQSWGQCIAELIESRVEDCEADIIARVKKRLNGRP